MLTTDSGRPLMVVNRFRWNWNHCKSFQAYPGNLSTDSVKQQDTAN